MNAPSQTPNRSEAVERSSSGETVSGFVVIGLLAAGGVGVLKAMSMDSGIDVLLCLLGSVAAFGALFYIYFGKR